MSTAANISKDKKLTPQEVVDGFRKLREEQRQMANKITEFEQEKSEHKLVSETLEGLDGERKCYRLISGVLIERTVKEVLPALKRNMDHLGKLIESLNEQVVEKGKEINDYREKYNIRIQGEDMVSQPKVQSSA
uniref:Prefoldin subunit 2 n=1 Tax=Romanomermis culicivorax TaxID=13658 RepID=A0A915KFU7_ROMCU